MTTARQSQAAMRLVRRHPRLGGVFLLAAGAVMAWESLATGQEMARFASDSSTEGRVVQVENIGRLLPDFRMTVAWTDAVGIEQTATTRVFKQDQERFAPGDPVELLVAHDDRETVMLKRIHDSQGRVRLGAAQATPLIFFGALMLLGGCLLAATGNRFLRPTD